MPTVMVVDDQPVVLRTIERMLRDQPYDVVLQESPVEALDFLNSAKIDIAVIDIRMPEMDGMELMRRIKKRDPSIAVIIVTAVENVSAIQEAYSEGAIGYLIKPASIGELHAALAKAMAVRQRHDTEIQRNALLEAKIRKLSHAYVDGFERSLQSMNVIMAQVHSFWAVHADVMSRLSADLVGRVNPLKGVLSETTLAARICDVGMVNVFDSTDPLYPTEKTPTLQHVKSSKRIAHLLYQNDRISLIVEQHHENWDGTGPLGLAGTKIVFGARALRIVDMFHTCISKRPGADAMNQRQVRDHLRRAIGRELDPDLTASFLAIFSERADKLMELAWSAERPAEAEIARVAALSNPDAKRQGTRGEFFDRRMVQAETPKLAPISRDEILAHLDDQFALGGFPFVAGEIIDISRRNSTTVDEMVKVISQDGMIAAMLLKAANSVVYSTGQRITDIKRAVMNIGVGGTGELVASMSLMDKFGDAPYNESCRPEWFWEHCLAVGHIGFEIARRLELPNPEEVYLAGLFHDLGRIVLDQVIPEHYHPILRLGRVSGESLSKLEDRYLHLTHAEVLKHLFDNLKLPKLYITISEHHHFSATRMKLVTNRLKGLALSLANSLAKLSLMGNGGDGYIDPIKGYCDELKVDAEMVNEILDSVVTGLMQSKLTFMVNASAPTFDSYSESLKSKYKLRRTAFFIGNSGNTPDEVKLFLRGLRILWTPDSEDPVDPPSFGVINVQSVEDVPTLANELQIVKAKHGIDDLPLIICCPITIGESDLSRFWNSNRCFTVRTPIHVEHFLRTMAEALGVAGNNPA
jgi:cyclic di-GMP phosphodiesterase